MRVFKLENMVRGWFLGGFSPTVLKTDAVEVAVKKYRKNDLEKTHYHKIANEITVIVKGKAQMNGNEFLEGDIVLLEKNEKSDFKALEDTMTVVVKIPGATNDKYED